MAKWGEIKCPRCAAPPMSLWDALARQLEESDAREATLNDRITMLEEHLCLTEEKLAKAVEALGKIAVHPDYRLPKPQDIARTSIAELKGQDDE